MAKHKGLRALLPGGVEMGLSQEKSIGQDSPSGDCRDLGGSSL